MTYHDHFHGSIHHVFTINAHIHKFHRQLVEIRDGQFVEKHFRFGDDDGSVGSV